MKRALALALMLCLLLGGALAEGLPGDTFNTGSTGANGAAACANPIAARIGVDILKAGGNAVDAAV